MGHIFCIIWMTQSFSLLTLMPDWCVHVSLCVSLVGWWVRVSEQMVSVWVWLCICLCMALPGCGACWALAPVGHGHVGWGSRALPLPAGCWYPSLRCRYLLVPGRVVGCSGMVIDPLFWWVWAGFSSRFHNKDTYTLPSFSLSHTPLYVSVFM